MLSFLRRLFSTPVDNTSERLARVERSLAEWEVTMTGLTDKMSSQLKRLAARHGTQPEKSREELLNDAIRARRRSRFTPNGDGE